MRKTHRGERFRVCALGAREIGVSHLCAEGIARADAVGGVEVVAHLLAPGHRRERRAQRGAEWRARRSSTDAAADRTEVLAALRAFERLIRGQETSDGAGVRLKRTLGQTPFARLDPFLMLDEFRRLVLEELKSMPEDPSWRTFFDEIPRWDERPGQKVVQLSVNGNKRSPEFLKWEQTNVYAQRQAGYSTVTVTLR